MKQKRMLDHPGLRDGIVTICQSDDSKKAFITLATESKQPVIPKWFEGEAREDILHAREVGGVYARP